MADGLRTKRRDPEFEPRARFDWIPDEIANAIGDGQQIALVLAGPPEPHAARLMASLGVPVMWP